MGQAHAGADTVAREPPEGPHPEQSVNGCSNAPSPPRTRTGEASSLGHGVPASDRSCALPEGGARTGHRTGGYFTAKSAGRRGMEENPKNASAGSPRGRCLPSAERWTRATAAGAEPKKPSHVTVENVLRDTKQTQPTSPHTCPSSFALPPAASSLLQGNSRTVKLALSTVCVRVQHTKRVGPVAQPPPTTQPQNRPASHTETLSP